MNAQGPVNGQCLGGAVTVTARLARPVIRACHCDMCRRHTSGMFISVETEPGSVSVDGPARSFRSSDWAERGFCAVCGSTLWYATLHDGARNMAAGLFDDAGGGVLGTEFFADRCPSGYALAEAHARLSTKETISMFTGSQGATT